MGGFAETNELIKDRKNSATQIVQTGLSLGRMNIEEAKQGHNNVVYFLLK